MDIAEDVKDGDWFDAKTYMQAPADVRAASEAIARSYSFDGALLAGAICAAILTERADSEARMLELLKDPVAVRLNWMRGVINADSIIAEERERCAKVAERDADWTEFQRRPKTNWKGDQTNVFAAPADEHLPNPANVFAYTTGIAAGRAIASAIRSGETGK